MVLYHAYHAGTLNLVLIHRLTKNVNQDAILMVGNEQLMGPIYNKLDKLISLGLFKKIIYCNECYGINAECVELCERSIKEYFDKIFRDNHVDIDRLDEIYTGVDTLHSFGVYLELINRRYFFLESYKNFFNDAASRVAGCRGTMPVYIDTMIKNNAGDGNSYFATKVIRPGSERQVNSIIFDYENEVYNISPQNKKLLFKFFGMPETINAQMPVDVLITCSQWVLRNYPDVKKRTITIYQYIADYFAGSNPNMIIKPHPLSRCDVDDYRENFNNIFVFEKEFPSNFMPLIDNLQVRNTYTICSTGAATMSSQTGQMYLTGFTFYKMYPNIHKLGYTFSLYKKIFSDLIFSSYGISNEFIERVKNYVFGLDSVPMKWTDVNNISNNFIVVDNIDWNSGNYKENMIASMHNTQKNYVVVCINSMEDYFFEEFLYDAKGLYLCIIKLEKELIKQNVVAPRETEYLFIFTNNFDTANKIKEFKYERVLSYTGYKIIGKTLNEDEHFRYLSDLKFKIIYNKFMQIKNSK